jgi:hypothetical protein
MVDSFRTDNFRGDKFMGGNLWADTLMESNYMVINFLDRNHSMDLSLVNTIGRNCRIYRETCGCYVVIMDEDPCHRRQVANLPCAYAICRSWEAASPPAPTGEPLPLP